MSSSAPSADPSLTVEEQLNLALQTAALERILSASPCFALYVWDFILTFPDEYRDMWKADRWTSVRVSFFFNRYLSRLPVRVNLCDTCSYWSLLVFVLAMCLFWFEFTPKTCDKIHILKPIAVTILLLNCQFLLGARVWVMRNRRKWVAYFFGTLAMAGTTVQVWSFSQNKALRLSLIAQRQNGRLTLLLKVFVRDGVLYFVVVSICNLINVVFFAYTIPEPSDAELQSEERRIEEKLRASYPGVMVDVEIETKMEARQVYPFHADLRLWKKKGNVQRWTIVREKKCCTIQP
ncbi:hypothetical protein BT69DRAFT_1293549 [Atractiella rhizophila]|nr:hypothetical protein BT69DRAFT_1293549 [Atractiella rhizophila]